MIQYRTVARFSVQVVTVVFFAVFILVAYHRLMPMTMSPNMSEGSASCEAICLLGATFNWQRTTEGAYALRAVELSLAALFSLLVIVVQPKFSLIASFLGKIIKFRLYYKNRWRLLWTRYWSHIYQRGIVPLRLYA